MSLTWEILKYAGTVALIGGLFIWIFEVTAAREHQGSSGAIAPGSEDGGHSDPTKEVK